MDSILGRIAATVLSLLLLAAVGLGIYKAFSGNKVSQTINDIAQLQTNARAQYSQGSSGYTNFVVNAGSPQTGLVNQNGTSSVIPTDMLRNSQVVDAWGNPVTIAPQANGQQFSVQFGGTGLSADQCSQVLTSLSGYVGLTTSGGGNFSGSNLPDATSAGAACQSNDETITVTLQ